MKNGHYVVLLLIVPLIGCGIKEKSKEEIMIKNDLDEKKK